MTFASFDSTDISLGEVQWKNGGADTWHTQTTTGDVTATNVRIVVKENANLGSIWRCVLMDRTYCKQIWKH